MCDHVRVPTAHLLGGDNRRTLQAIAANSIDAVVTDPPYGLGAEPDMAAVLEHWIRGDDWTASGGGFMGRTWDSFVPGPATWREVFRVLKPGGHVVMFSGTRTWDIATLALRLAGFEIRDGLMWLYGSGFPKSMNVSQAIDKAAGAEREKVPVGDPVKRMIPGADQNSTGSWIKDNGREYQPGIELPATPEAEQWEGWGTALKPAWEPIVLARKPVETTVAANVLTHGTGALNIDATRIATTDPLGGGAETKTTADQKGNDGWTRPWMDDPDAQAAHAERVRANVVKAEQLGRFPANVVLSHTPDCELVGTKRVKTAEGVWTGRMGGSNGPVYGMFDGDADPRQGTKVGFGDADGLETVEDWVCTDDCPVRILDDMTGSTGEGRARAITRTPGGIFGNGADVVESVGQMFGDTGGASRFLYTSKTSREERNRGMPSGVVNDHPTVKPVELMRWLVKLVTPPSGIVLDPFVGSGSTGVAACLEQHDFIGLDNDPHSIMIAKHRIGWSLADVVVAGPADTVDVPGSGPLTLFG